MRIKIIKKNIKHPNDKIIDATGDRFVDVSVSSGDRLVIEAQGQTTVITANANQLAQGAIENSQGLQFKRLNFDLLVGNGETTYVRISRFYLMSDVQLESVSWNGQLLNDTFVGQLNTWQYGSMVAESPISVSDPGAFVGVSNVSDTVAMGSATTTQVASVGGFSPIGWVASVPATAAGAGISMTGAAVVGGGALLASAAAKGKSSDSSSSTPDTASPTFVSATTSTDGKKIILTYSEDLGATTAKADAFTVKVGSTVVAINSVAVVGKTIELTMSTAIKKGDAITFAYQAPASDASTTNTAIQDKTGNDAASLTTTAVTNNVPDSSDTTPPTITSFTSNTANGSYKAGSSIDIRATASEALQSGAQITVTLDTGETVTLTRDTSTANLLVGSYTVGIGKSSADLNVSSYTLGTGLATPKDIAGNAMTSTTVPANNIAGSKDIVVDTTAPAALDLVSGTVGTQATESQYYAATNAGSGKAIAPNVAQSTDTDVAKITVTVGGTADTTNDALVFGTVTQTLNTTAAPGGTNVTINGVTGVDWSYSAGKVLTLSKTGGGAFTAAQVQLIEQGLQFKTASGATQGDRTFAIAHQDTAGNTGTAGTETVTVDTMAPAALDLVSGTVGTQATESQYYAATNAGSGKAIAPNVALSTDTDIAKITVTVGGTADTTNDALVFGTVTQALNTTAAPGGTNVTINGVTGVDWSYSAGKVLTLSKTGGGAFTAAQVQLIEQGLQFKTTSGATQGDRTFTIAHQDTAGNTGTAGTETVTVDTTAPTLTSAATGTDGTKIVLTYDENLLTTTNQAATTAFTVLVGGAEQTVSSVASSGNTVTLNLSSAITSGQTVTVAYADPTSGDDINAVQDLSGNDAATLAATRVTNNSTSSSGPSLASVQKLNNVTNLDVRSALVIAFDSPISLNSGKIKILDDMGTSGWTHTNQSTVDSVHPELTQSIQDTSDNDIVITLENGAVTAITIGGIDRTSRFDLAKSVTVNGNNLVIDLTQKFASGPGYSDGTVNGTVKTSATALTSDLEHTAFDWDFGSNYHVEFDAGIVKNANSKTNVALSDSTTLNFTTVTPSTSTTATASQIMDSTGASTTLSAGKRWVSGNQSQLFAAAQVIDMNQGDVAVVVDSMGESTRGTNLAGNVQLNNFGADDLIYMDNHGDMSMITTDGLAVGNPATWSNTTRTLSNPSGNNSLLHVYKDAGVKGMGVNGDQFLDSTLLDSNLKSQNIVIFG